MINFTNDTKFMKIVYSNQNRPTVLATVVYNTVRIVWFEYNYQQQNTTSWQ